MIEFILLYALVTAIGLALFFFARRLADVDGATDVQIIAAESLADEAINLAAGQSEICDPGVRSEAARFLNEARKCRAYNQSGLHPFATRNSTWRKRIRAKSKADFAYFVCTGRMFGPRNRTLIF